MKKKYKSLFLPLIITFPLFLKPVLAWENHALETFVVLSSLPEVQKLDRVKAETLENFLSAERTGLVSVLAAEEEWARKNVPHYPPRPDGLSFKGSSPNLRGSFLRALRVNPSMKLPLFLQSIPGQKVSPRPRLAPQELTLLPGSIKPSKNRFHAIKENESVSAAEIVSTATDEPDYGLDIGLWEDSGTPFGMDYKFGKQPFGNPVVEFSTQAPFHMGFYHESPIVYKAASFLKRTFPEFRIHLFSTLARYAMNHDHPYWGLRFAGWALHYIQDLTQPYHSTVLPGVGLLEMLFLNFKDIIGFHGPKREMVQLVTNQHLALENFAYFMFTKILETHEDGHPVILALKKAGHDPAASPFSENSPRERITVESNSMALRTSEALKKALPFQLVSDPNYLFGTTDPDINVFEVAGKGSPENKEALDKLLEELMAPFGKHTAIFIRSIL